MKLFRRSLSALCLALAAGVVSPVATAAPALTQPSADVLMSPGYIETVGRMAYA